VRVLVTGARGQLGLELVDAFAGHDVVATDQGELDVADRDQVLAAASALCPDVIVHSAAWTDVDGCETDPDRAMRVNALGTRHVVAGARLAGARVCYLSTDYVFDGAAGRPYTEWDAANPLSVYGRSKLGGEAELGPDDTIVRTSWLCGTRGRNFVRTVLERAARGEELRVVDDQHGCFTLAADLAGAIRRFVVERLSGRYHVTNQGPTTWFQLARDAVVLAGHHADLVRPISTAELRPRRAAPRPPFAVLDNAALRLAGFPLLPGRHDALERLVRDLTVPPDGRGSPAAKRDAEALTS
jgi:dTDP-4-dehydrorhamnose reductase